MPKEKITKENLYVYYNSLISIGSINETGSTLYSKYLVRMENLEQTLLLKKCQVPLSEFTDLKESLFFIREIEENKSSSLYNKKIIHNKNLNDDVNSNEKDDEYIKEKRVNYNQQFILQHMISKNFISVENMPGNNNYSLKLTSDINTAAPFILERIHETRSLQEFLTFKQSFYISVFVKEKDQYFYVNSNSYFLERPLKYDVDSNLIMNSYNNLITNEHIKENLNKNINKIEEKEDVSENNYANFYENFSELCIEKKMNTKYMFVNQSWYIKNKDVLFSSQVVNIVFINSNLYKTNFKNSQITEKEEQFMLSAECVENNNEEEIYDSKEDPEDTNYLYHKKTDSNFYDINKGLISQIVKRKKNNLNRQIRVKVIPYENEFYKHVINNCFWVIEEEIYDYEERLKKVPLIVGSQIKIKNILLGLYLKVKKKGSGIKSNINNEDIIDNENIENNEEVDEQRNHIIKMENEEDNEYEFELVDEETLINKSFFLSNFRIFHYNIDKKMKFMDFKGKYALRSIFKEKDENFDFEELTKYFQPLSISIDLEKKYSLLMKNEDDYIFEIRRVDIFEANHVIYIKKLIQNLNYFLKKCKNNEIEVNNAIKVILLNITFFMNYLLNIEYIFRDEKYDINLPIEQRQLALENFGILRSIVKIAEYLISIIQEIKYRKEQMFKMKKFNKNKNNSQMGVNTFSIYQYETLNEKYNINNSIIIDTQKLIKTILEFLTFLSKDNEEIKEKIFLDLDLILELAENLFMLDRSILLNFIFNLIDNSEVLQEYVTGGKLNLISSIKNSKRYNNYTEKENKNKLIRMDRILLYIETSYNYLYYYKKLLTLNKVKHKEEQIKKLISDHMLKIDSEFNLKNNYKRYLINIIQKSKMIIKRIEKPLIQNAINTDKLAEKELNASKLRSPIKPKRNSTLKRDSTIFKKDDKSNSESKFFLNKNTLDETLNLEKNEEDPKEDNLRTSKNKKDLLRRSILKKKSLKEEEKESTWRKNSTKGIFNIFKDLFGIKNEEEKNISIISKNSTGEERISTRLKIEQSLREIKLFLAFFEKFDINKTLFIKDKIFSELFESFDEAKNSKSKLSYVVNGDTKSIQLMDGIKLDPESELGQVIPFHLFNKFFPKFRSENESNVFQNYNYLDVINENIDEDSENELYDEKDYKKIFDDNINNIDIKRGISEKVKLTNSVIDNNNLSKINTFRGSARTINNSVRHSKTNAFNLINQNKNNLKFDEHIIAEIEQKQIEKDLNKLNKYLCKLYTIYQFCVNQYYDTLHKVLKIINNYFINYEFFCDMEMFKKNMKKIKDNLLSRIVFLNNEVLTNLYNAAKEKPTLLKGVFDFDKFVEEYPDDEKLENNKQNNDFDFHAENGKNVGYFRKKDIKIEKDKYKIKELSQEEMTLIKSLFYFCNKYDKINYIKDKIKYLKKIKNLIDISPKNQKNNLLANQELLDSNKYNIVINQNKDINDSLIYNKKNDIYISEFINILEKLYKKRNKILAAYIDIHNSKKYLTANIKSQKDKNSKNVVPLGYDIDKRFNIIIKLLMEYEIDNILGKLIYLDMNKNSIYFETNILKNLKLVQSTFKEIESLIKKIRIDYDRRGDNCLKIILDQNNNIVNQINVNNSKYNRDCFQRLNSCLSKMTINFLNFLNINSNSLLKFKDMSKLSQMLYKENENFYKKIGFDKIFENLIETIDCFYDFDNNPMVKLKYCQEILRIFMEVQNIYKNFKEIIPEYFELYYKMIIRSLHSIILYKNDKIGEEEEKTFLKICYYSCESFILIIFNSKKIFSELRSFMIDILSKLLKIYSQLKIIKNRIIFQILYTYYISRVLLFISKEKYFDDFSYNSFFQIVYPMETMHEQILSCMNEIVKKTETEESSEDEDDEKSDEEETYEENKADEDKNKAKSNKTPLIKNNIINTDTKNDENENDSFVYYHNNKYYNNYLKRREQEIKKLKSMRTMKTINNLKINQYLHNNNIIPEDNYENDILWESDEEKEKLSFYLNYLSIYVLYLHDRNSIKKIRDNLNKENNINIIEYDFKNLYTKIQKLLEDYSIRTTQNLKNQIETFVQNNNYLSSNNMKYNLNQLKLSILNNQETNNHRVKNNYQFESVLIESIILYKYRTKEQNVEIPVKNKKVKNKTKMSITPNETGETDKTSSLSDKIIKFRTNDLISFYYYDNEYLDLIFLEKICNDIHISNNMNYYCTEKSIDLIDDGNHEDLLQKILSMKKEYKLITSYYKGEYDKLHDQYINNDMEEFILLLKNRFTNNDFNRIYSMKKFLYKRMNEIYSEDLYNLGSLSNRKILPFIDKFKSIENIRYHLNPSYKNISLYSYLTSLVYIYPKYPKKTCILYYKIGFLLLGQKFRKLNIEENQNKKTEFNNNTNEDNVINYKRCSLKDTVSVSCNKQHTSEEKEYEYDKIIEGLILIFSREINRNIIQEDEVFFTMINSLILFLKDLKENSIYLVKNNSLIRQLFIELDFAFDHLFQDFEKIVNFMKSAENQKLKDKYRKNEERLKIIIIFIITFLSLQKAGDNNSLTKNIIEFIQNLTGQIIKLVLILIEIGKEDNMKTADILVDFFYFFIEGPNINNLNSLFAYRFFNLVTYIITNVDYYKIFWNNINNVNLHHIMDSYAKIEQKILKIFFVYYNVSYNNQKNTKEYLRIREWYEKNYEYIKIKLKKLYLFSQVEMEKRSFDIDNALIYKKRNDSYTDEELFQRAGILNNYDINKISLEEKLNIILGEAHYNEINDSDYLNYDFDVNFANETLNDTKTFDNLNNNLDLLYKDKAYKLNKENYCLIKFDLLLIYYTLNVYYKDIINEEYLEIITPTDSFFENVVVFFKKLFIFIFNVVCAIYDLIRYLYRHVNEKAKAKVELLQELNTIDEDCLSVNEKNMFLDLSSKIKCVEVSINHILYKVYFPIINKAKKIEENTEYYLFVANENLHNYISSLISNYDRIHISVTKNYYFDKLSEIPIVNLMFKNINLFGIILMIIGIITNVIISLSYSTFTNEAECDCNTEENHSCSGESRRLYCPRFLYNNKSNYVLVRRTLHIFGLFQLIFQMMVIFDFIFRNFSINWALSKNNCKIKKSRLLHKKSNITISKCEYIRIVFGTIWSLVSFQFLYYVLYILFIFLGYFNHPFFYGFSLLEIINRVEVMSSVLKAMYVPKVYLLINFIMFIMLEYLFSLFALSIFTSHFPNITDSKNFLKTFMRMIDQTFKQDGGIGTYLDQSKDPDYVQYTPKAYAGGRFWFDLLFYLIILLVIFQIFTSIIIDYFMNTRKNKEYFTKKSKTECLICRLEREKLEKIYLNAKDAFKKHTYHCHNIRNYINYLFYLQSLSYRDPIIEESVWNYHLENKNSYLPDKTCFQLKEKRLLESIKLKNIKEDKFK